MTEPEQPHMTNLHHTRKKHHAAKAALDAHHDQAAVAGELARAAQLVGQAGKGKQ